MVTGFAIPVILGPRDRYLPLPSFYPYRQHAIFNIVDRVHIFGRFASDMTRKLRTLCSNRPGTKNANPLLTSRISEAAPRSSSIPQAPLAPQAPGFCKLPHAVKLWPSAPGFPQLPQAHQHCFSLSKFFPCSHKLLQLLLQSHLFYTAHYLLLATDYLLSSVTCYCYDHYHYNYCYFRCCLCHCYFYSGYNSNKKQLLLIATITMTLAS